MAISTNEVLVDTDSAAGNLGREDMRTPRHMAAAISKGRSGSTGRNDLQYPLRRLSTRSQLRRFVDRVGLARRRAHRALK
jgi:hypothetical protein